LHRPSHHNRFIDPRTCSRIHSVTFERLDGAEFCAFALLGGGHGMNPPVKPEDDEESFAANPKPRTLS
ncbi:hypothetical protein, partial [Mesorhizobium sp.]|uniref:hypothetical protein n=1 Tax=Mesorhizobium sp. TaxID=1871066 RepID=UPI0025DEDB5F